jgi:hypothetical protein
VGWSASNIAWTKRQWELGWRAAVPEADVSMLLANETLLTGTVIAQSACPHHPRARLQRRVLWQPAV